jgi:hypothetical protein
MLADRLSVFEHADKYASVLILHLATTAWRSVDPMPSVVGPADFRQGSLAVELVVTELACVDLVALKFL